MVEGRKIVLDVLEINQAPNGFTRSQSSQRLDLLRSSAEACTLEKVCREVVIPIGRPNRCEVILPLCRTGFLRESRDCRNRSNYHSNHCGSKHGDSLFTVSEWLHFSPGLKQAQGMRTMHIRRRVQLRIEN